MATFYDTHAHLDYPDYANDLPEVIARAQAAGIAKMISIGTSLSSSERAIRLAETISIRLCRRRLASHRGDESAIRPAPGFARIRQTSQGRRHR